jgi:hypothetical protein
MGKPRRKRADMTLDEAHRVMVKFSQAVVRFAETSDQGPFTNPSSTGKPAMGRGYVNGCFMLKGSFGAFEDVFMAVRVLGGHMLPKRTGISNYSEGKP